MINIENFLSKYFKEDDKIILACSTWPDSMFLLYKILETKYKKNLVVCYFNHKLRPESEQEEKFIKNLWKKLLFKVEVASADIKKIRTLYPSKSLEELAREKRYDFLWAIRDIYKAPYIITAHHLDDKIETFFFNLSRWSKLSWLINMTEKSWLILRPLLNLEKKFFLKYLDENKLKYFIDSTNYNTKITRNYLRQEVIPKFWKINKNYKKNIKNTLHYFEQLKEYIDNEVIEFLDSKNNFFITEFNKLSDFLQNEVLRYIYFKANWNSTIWLSESNLKEIKKFINWKRNKTIKEIKKLKMKKDWNKIFFNI